MEFITDYKLEKFILNTQWEDLPEEVQKRAVVCGIDLTIALLLGSKGQQFQGIQHTAQIRPAQRGPHVLNSVKRRAALQHHHMSRGAGFFQPTAHLPTLAAGAQIPRRLLCRIADSLRRQHFQYPGQLHRPQ